MFTLPVILLNYNSSEDCRKCIGDLQRQVGVSLDIIVVDNCSQLEERLAIERLCKETGCTFIANDTNRGYNAGNNVGLRYAAEKEYFFAVIANPDMEFPQNDYFSKLLACIQADEDIAVCGSDIVTPEGIHQNPRQYPEWKWQHYFRWVKEALFQKKGGDTPEWIAEPEQSRYCQALNGCCELFRMSFLKKIGFLDEGIFLYGEEPILGHLVHESGMKAYYTAECQAVHNHRKSREAKPSVCSKHWRHSQLHSIKRYSHFPWYGRLFAYTSVHTYFFLLNLYHCFRGK